MTVRLLVGDCREHMLGLAAASVDAVVTDPPYGLEFMGQGWDRGVPGLDFWFCMKHVLKPGGHLLAFGGTRTFHRMTCAIEDAGFEIRDCLSYLYGSGFPKSLNLSGEWSGWGTALKPAWEPIILARKPLTGTVAANVTAHGTGALNIAACRIGIDGGHRFDGDAPQGQPGVALAGSVDGSLNGWRTTAVEGLGRWPANVVLDEEAAALLDAQSGARRSAYPGNPDAADAYAGSAVDTSRSATYASVGKVSGLSRTDTGGASRFFYTAKASTAERSKGLDPGERSTHPTVKPLDLMQWLVRLITPPGGTVLDPFMGSGTTGIAADREGFDFIGIEQDPEYAEIARRRIIGDAPLFANLSTA